MDQDKLKMTVNGQEKVYDVYYSFTCPQTDKGYIAYTEHQIDVDGNEIILISAYDPKASTTELIPVEDEKEMNLVKSVLEKIKKIA